LILLAVWACFGARNARAQDQTGRTAPEESSRPEDATAAAVDCRELAAMLQQQKSLISRETGQLKREIAALRDDLLRPGIKEIFAGIGYIFGLAGIGLYVHSRRMARK
jgi:hypothetical protein